MKDQPVENISQAVELTLQILEELKNRGFLYVRVNAFTQDNSPHEGIKVYVAKA